MNFELLEQAKERVPSIPVLVNMCSLRVKQINQGMRPLVKPGVGEETIEVNGKPYDCVKISFVLTAFSWAWTGFYWYEKKSGQLVQAGEKGKNAEKNGYQLFDVN